jgi:hypothetical protein
MYLILRIFRLPVLPAKKTKTNPQYKSQNLIKGCFVDYYQQLFMIFLRNDPDAEFNDNSR